MKNETIFNPLLFGRALIFTAEQQLVLSGKLRRVSGAECQLVPLCSLLRLAETVLGFIDKPHDVELLAVNDDGVKEVEIPLDAPDGKLLQSLLNCYEAFPDLHLGATEVLHYSRSQCFVQRDVLSPNLDHHVTIPFFDERCSEPIVLCFLLYDASILNVNPSTLRWRIKNQQQLYLNQSSSMLAVIS